MKNETPKWLPFAILASFMVAVGAGIKSGWRTSADEKPPQPPAPPGPPAVKQAGVIFP